MSQKAIDIELIDYWLRLPLRGALCYSSKKKRRAADRCAAHYRSVMVSDAANSRWRAAARCHAGCDAQVMRTLPRGWPPHCMLHMRDIDAPPMPPCVLVVIALRADIMPSMHAPRAERRH
jgi:hypothetical protein